MIGEKGTGTAVAGTHVMGGGSLWGLRSRPGARSYHWGQHYYILFLLFCGIIFGNYYRKLYSIIFLGDIPAVPDKFEKKKSVFNFWPLLQLVEVLIRRAFPL